MSVNLELIILFFDQHIQSYGIDFRGFAVIALVSAHVLDRYLPLCHTSLVKLWSGVIFIFSDPFRLGYSFDYIISILG